MTEDEQGPPSLIDRVSRAFGEPPVVSSLSVSGLFVFACLAFLYFARDVFIPIALSLMLSFVFRPVVRGFEAIRLPAVAGSALVTLLVVVATALAGVRLSDPAAEWAEKLPSSLRVAERKTRPLRAPVATVTDLADRVERITQVDKGRAPQVRLQEPGLAGAAVSAALGMAGQAVIVLVALFFMLAWGDGLLAKMVAWVPDLREQRHAVEVIRSIERQMTAYLGTVSVINVALGGALALALAQLGMPNPMLWGALAAVLNFIPYLGSVAGIAIVAFVSLVTFDSWQAILAPPAVYLVLTALEGQVLTPIVLGRRFRMSPLVIFVWLVFWAWLWGVAGAVLAVPLLVLIKITCEQSPRLAKIARFIAR